MDQDNAPQEPQKVTATVTCPHCGQTFETEVELPEPTETPKMAWQT